MPQTALNPLPAPPEAAPEPDRTRCACADAPALCPECYAAWVRVCHEVEARRWLAEWDASPDTLVTFEREADAAGARLLAELDGVGA